MRITLAQLNAKVGDIEGNKNKIKHYYKKAIAEKSDIIVFPELAITGYPPLDLIEKKSFIEKNLKALNEIVKETGETACVIGYIDINNKKRGKKLHNSAAFIQNKKILLKTHKTLLPTYDIFDEERYFEPYIGNKIIKFKNKNIAITICEEIWADTKLLPNSNLYAYNPMKNILKKAELIINLSASPFEKNKFSKRLNILSELSKKHDKEIVYLNATGANDELIFDGGSFIIAKNGKKIKALSQFKEECETIELNEIISRKVVKLREEEEIKEAIILGIRDYFQKQGFSKAVIGLSGGIDSALVATLAAQALGSQNILGVLMPSPYTSRQSVEDALKLAKNLNIKTEIVDIGKIYDSYAKTLFLNKENIDISLQNIQSRIRGNILMSFSNRYGYLVLTTGNKSEISMGYCTLYGDTAGAIAPIGDLLKTDVYKLANFLNTGNELIPLSIIKRPPTAELKPGQKDQDDLPPYEILDRIIKLYIEENLSTNEIAKKIGDRKLAEDTILRIERNEYKRKQLPITLKLSKKSFGAGRKFPIVKGLDCFIK